MEQSAPHEVRGLFARSGLRCTRQRMELYRALAGTKSHPTPEELFWTVRQRQPGLSLATVYNTLEAFCRHGLCRKLPPIGSGGARYDADLTDHLHLLTETGAVRDVPQDLGNRLLQAIPPDMLDELERRMGVRITRVAIDLIGEERGSAEAASAEPTRQDAA